MYNLLVVEQTTSSVSRYSPDGTLLKRIAVGYFPHEIETRDDTAYVSNFGLQDYDERIGNAGYSIR
jgi:hypothetical protein